MRITPYLAAASLLASCSTPTPSAPVPKEVVDRGEALGAWRSAGSDNGISAFVFDGASATLFLFTEKDWMWRARDDHYRVKTRWQGNDLQYLPPFGRWSPLAQLQAGGFAGFERLDTAGALSETESALLRPHPLHDYDTKPTDPRSWQAGIPKHLEHWPGISIRDADKLLNAPEHDVVVARAYPTWADKGPVVDGFRVSISTARTVVRVGEPVRVIHVAEVTRPDGKAWVMGPKTPFGEYVDGELRTRLPEVPGYPWVGMYDGRVLDGPNADYNFEITEYRFAKPGVHEIQWRPGASASNTLTIVVVP